MISIAYPRCGKPRDWMHDKWAQLACLCATKRRIPTQKTRQAPNPRRSAPLAGPPKQMMLGRSLFIRAYNA
jgi:hypothetical protein